MSTNFIVICAVKLIGKIFIFNLFICPNVNVILLHINPPLYKFIRNFVYNSRCRDILYHYLFSLDESFKNQLISYQILSLY